MKLNQESDTGDAAATLDYSQLGIMGMPELDSETGSDADDAAATLSDLLMAIAIVTVFAALVLSIAPF